MTNREAQLFQWIAENPMISQEELAAKAGIKRSSVAVHISNLMKKGYIQGKGYITNVPTYCSVVGAVNIDIGGAPQGDLISNDSNPGSVSISLGGVGRNIAHNMRLMGLGVKFVTALGDDVYAHKIMESCSQLNIDVADSYRSVLDPTSTYVFITDKEGEMQLAISDMNICRHLTPNFIDGKMEMLNNGRMIIMDTNIPEDTIDLIATRSKVPVYADPVSCTKAAKLLPILGKLNTVTPNVLEAEVLSGVKITDETSLRKAAEAILKRGVEQVFITLGTKGVYCANEEEAMHVPNIPSKLVNATGAGDAFMAGLTLAATRNMSLRETALVGLAAASIAVESVSTINTDISIDNIVKRAGLEL